MKQNFKVGKVAIVGRPNVGKSTLLNNLVQAKVSIISSKPQTTRGLIEAVFEDERGQIFFLDTPGYYTGKSSDAGFLNLISQSINEADLVLYVVDHTRDWGREDAKIWEIIQDSGKETMLVINKTDIKSPTYLDAYHTLVAAYTANVFLVSALKTSSKPIIEAIFDKLSEGSRDKSVDQFPSPLISQNSSEYLAEIIREKIFSLTGE